MLQRQVYPDGPDQLSDMADTLDELGINVYTELEDGVVISLSFQMGDETVVFDVDPEALREWGVGYYGPDPDRIELERMWRE